MDKFMQVLKDQFLLKLTTGTMDSVTPVAVKVQSKRDIPMSEVNAILYFVFSTHLTFRSLKPHLNICLFYGVCENDKKDQVWIVSELCSLGDLRTLLNIKPEKLSSELVISFAKDICRGMHFIHVIN